MSNVLQNVLPLSPSAPVPLSSIIGYKTTLIPSELMEAGKKTINDIIRKYGRDPEDFTVEKVFTLCTDWRSVCNLCPPSPPTGRDSRSSLRHVLTSETHWKSLAKILGPEVYDNEPQVYWKCPVRGCTKSVFAGRGDGINSHLSGLGLHDDAALAEALCKEFSFAGKTYRIVPKRYVYNDGPYNIAPVTFSFPHMPLISPTGQQYQPHHHPHPLNHNLSNHHPSNYNMQNPNLRIPGSVNNTAHTYHNTLNIDYLDYNTFGNGSVDPLANVAGPYLSHVQPSSSMASFAPLPSLSTSVAGPSTQHDLAPHCSFTFFHPSPLLPALIQVSTPPPLPSPPLTPRGGLSPLPAHPCLPPIILDSETNTPPATPTALVPDLTLPLLFSVEYFERLEDPETDRLEFLSRYDNPWYWSNWVDFDYYTQLAESVWEPTSTAERSGLTSGSTPVY